MVRSILHISFFLLWSGFAYAQYYSFTQSTGAYQPLTNTTSINNGEVWDDAQYTIPIGFNFEILGENHDSITISEGLAFFGPEQTESISAFGYALAGADLVDRGFGDSISFSPILFTLSGTSGNKILKIEWQNAGLYDDQNPYNDSINFQLWLYESNHDVEIHFGPSSVDTSSYYLTQGPIIGISFYDRFFYSFTDGAFLNGLSASPAIDTFLAALRGTPDSGIIFRFSKNYNPASKYYPVSEIDIKFQGDLIFIDIPDRYYDLQLRAELISINGQILRFQDLNRGRNIFSCEDGNNELYIFRIISDSELLLTRKFFLPEK